jgi:hypothetical protein
MEAWYHDESDVCMKTLTDIAVASQVQRICQVEPILQSPDKQQQLLHLHDTGIDSAFILPETPQSLPVHQLIKNARITKHLGDAETHHIVRTLQYPNSVAKNVVGMLRSSSHHKRHAYTGHHAEDILAICPLSLMLFK